MAELSAQAIIRDTLAQFGLSSLSQTAWDWHLDGKPIEQVMLDIRNTPEHQARFPGFNDMAKRGRIVSEQAWVEYERGFVQLAKAANLPQGFYDQPQDIAKFITGENSLEEVGRRIQMAQQASYTAPVEVRQELTRLYGFTDGEITSYWLDPDVALPTLQMRAQAAENAAVAQQTGYGALSANQAERLAQLGITADAVRSGFASLVENRELLGQLPGGSVNSFLTSDEQLAAIFDQDVEQQRRIQRTRANRLAQFAEGGGFASTQGGFAGLGDAD